MPEIKPVKDPSRQPPVPTEWRGTFQAIVRSFVSGDFQIKHGIRNLEPIDPKVAENAKAYLENYGERLVELPEETWKSSATLWMSGYWEVLVDLWTAESGASDLVLSARVKETAGDFHFEVFGLYVP